MQNLEAHEEAVRSNEASNEGTDPLSYEIRGKVLEALQEKEASARVYAVFDYTRFHPEAPLIEAKEFVDTHMTGETPRGFPIWDVADSAGKFMGGIGVTDESGAYYYALKNGGRINTVQYSVLWNEDGTRGGIGGGVKGWHAKDAEGNLTEEILGYVNF